MIRDGGPWRLLLYFGLSCVGFALGHLLGLWRDWVFLPLGSLNLGVSSLGSILTLILGDWLSRFEVHERSKV